MSELSELIRSRRSVRSFDGEMPGREEVERLEQYAAGIVNPFGIPVEFVMLDAKEHGLSSPVLAGERMYVAGKLKRLPYAELALGFSFEKLLLYAWSLGIGSTWIAGTMNRELFEKAAGLQAGDMMPCVSPLGYPARKKSVKEVLMRKGVGADSRMPAEKLFFEGELNAPLTEKRKEELSSLMEMVRWAPSAVNKQPWRIILRDEEYHFYEKKEKGYVREATGDLQKIDLGIALCHFVMGLEEQRENPRVVIRDPGIRISPDMEYLATVQR